MLNYVLKRLILFIPTLLVIAILAFALSKAAPGDPVLLYLKGAGESDLESKVNQERIYRQAKIKLGLDKPSFYLAILPQAYPDTLYRILTQDERQVAKTLVNLTGNWQQVRSFQSHLAALHQKSLQVPDSLAVDALVSIRRRLKDLQNQKDTSLLRKRLVLHQEAINKANLRAAFEPEQSNLEEAYELLWTDLQKARLYRPQLVWYGFDNQFHLWLSNLLKGEMGYSFEDGRRVSTKIARALRWTVLINGLALIIAYALSVFLGVWMAVNKDKRKDYWTKFFLFVIYSLPSFWIATLLLIFLTTPDYGMQLFSVTEISSLSKDASFWEQFRVTAKHIVLPVFCLAYAPLAVIALQMRGAMLDVLDQDYIRTARAKGLSTRKVIWKHTFRNALFPIITLLAGLFPSMIAGSVIIENIFNIPGMGQLIFDSIQNKDWPVVYMIMLFSAILTILGILIADLLYAFADPRVRFADQSKNG